MRHAVIGLAIVGASLPASAQGVLGTTETKGYPMRQGGQLSGCALEFNSIVQDQIYRQGGYSVVGGSIVFQKSGTNAEDYAVGLKVVVNDLSVVNGKAVRTPARPHSAYLLTDDEKTNMAGFIQRAASDAPGGLISAYAADDSFTPIFAQIMEKNSITVAFNRAAGGLDVRVPIDFTVESADDKMQRKHSAKAVAGFSTCMTELLGPAE